MGVPKMSAAAAVANIVGKMAPTSGHAASVYNEPRLKAHAKLVLWEDDTFDVEERYTVLNVHDVW
jgi:hypothetical protein